MPILIVFTCAGPNAIDQIEVNRTALRLQQPLARPPVCYMI